MCRPYISLDPHCLASIHNVVTLPGGHALHKLILIKMLLMMLSEFVPWVGVDDSGCMMMDAPVTFIFC